MRREAVAAGLRVHGDRDDGVVSVRLGDVDVRVERLVAKDLLRAWIEEVAPNVGVRVAASVRVDDIDLRRTAGEETIDDGVEIRGEHLLSLRIFLGVTEEEGAPVVLSRGSFHVVVDEDADGRGWGRRSPGAG